MLAFPVCRRCASCAPQHRAPTRPLLRMEAPAMPLPHAAPPAWANPHQSVRLSVRVLSSVHALIGLTQPLAWGGPSNFLYI